MEQNTNLLINVINNITVTNTILISIAIIVGSVEITVLLNKGIIFLINFWKSKNAPYENDYYIYKDIVGKFNSITEKTPHRRFESIEFLRTFSSEKHIRLLYIEHWKYLEDIEFNKPKYKFKNNKLEKKKCRLFEVLSSFNFVCKQYLDVKKQLNNKTIDNDSFSIDENDPKVKNTTFCKEASKLVEVYDDFVIACDDKFNFPIEKTPVDRIEWNFRND